MRKTRAFIVKSDELFKSGKLSVKAAMDNPNIKKYCPSCGGLLVQATVYEHSQEEDALFCLSCMIYERQEKEEGSHEDKRTV